MHGIICEVCADSLNRGGNEKSQRGILCIDHLHCGYRMPKPRGTDIRILHVTMKNPIGGKSATALGSLPSTSDIGPVSITVGAILVHLTFDQMYVICFQIARLILYSSSVACSPFSSYFDEADQHYAHRKATRK